MRFSTVQFNKQAVNSILDQQTLLAKVQQQVATGRKFVNPSDDPVNAASVLLLKQRYSQTEAFKKNADTAETRLNLEETALQNMMETLQRVQELQVRAGNSILGKDDRDAIVQEMKTLRDELVGLANTKDENNQFLFSGGQVNAQPFTQNTAGNFIYNGDATQRFVTIESGLSIPISDSGFDIFVNIPNGNGTFQILDPGAGNTGSGTISTGAVIDQSTYVPDTYTITFVTNSAGKLAYQIVGASTGQIVPALPATTPANAPDYVAGQSIVFNGIQVTINGAPNIGDDFQVKPSTKQNLLDTISGMITSLELPFSSDRERAIATNQLSQSFAALEQAINRILDTRAQIGTRLNAIDTANAVNENFSIHTQTVISALEDVDYAKATSDLQFQTVVLQAAQQSFLLVQKLSIFSLL